MKNNNFETENEVSERVAKDIFNSTVEKKLSGNMSDRVLYLWECMKQNAERFRKYPKVSDMIQSQGADASCRHSFQKVIGQPHSWKCSMCPATIESN